MKKKNLKMYEKPKVEVVEIHLNECIAGSGAVQVKTGGAYGHQNTAGGDWNQGWVGGFQ